MKKTLLLLLCITFLGTMHAGNYNTCRIKNTSTKSGEVITYKVYYTLAGAWIGAGQATFSNTLATMNGKPVYHIIGSGKTFKSYDWFFKVRDKYETYIDTTTMLPYKFKRDVKEGGTKFYKYINFDQKNKRVTTKQGTKKVPGCIQDVLSSIYFARNINFSKYKVGTKIPLTIFLDNEVYEIYIRYLGKFKLKTKNGTYKTIKFKPLLIDGTIFDGGEKMTVWVTDDKNKIPVHIETPIAVGQIRVDLVGYKGLRNPATGIVKLNK